MLYQVCGLSHLVCKIVARYEKPGGLAKMRGIIVRFVQNPTIQIFNRFRLYPLHSRSSSIRLHSLGLGSDPLDGPRLSLGTREDTPNGYLPGLQSLLQRDPVIRGKESGCGARDLESQQGLRQLARDERGSDSCEGKQVVQSVCARA